MFPYNEKSAWYLEDSSVNKGYKKTRQRDRKTKICEKIQLNGNIEALIFLKYKLLEDLNKFCNN
jgi:hypothetical protein